MDHLEARVRDAVFRAAAACKAQRRPARIESLGGSEADIRRAFKDWCEGGALRGASVTLRFSVSGRPVLEPTHPKPKGDPNEDDWIVP